MIESYYRTLMAELFSYGHNDASVAHICYAPDTPVMAERTPMLAEALRGIGGDLGTSADLIVVGSARFGFSVSTGLCFDPTRSDLDLAIVDADLFHKCVSSSRDCKLESFELRTKSGIFRPDLTPSTAFTRKWLASLDRVSAVFKDYFIDVTLTCYRDERAFFNAAADGIGRYRQLCDLAATNKGLRQIRATLAECQLLSSAEELGFAPFSTAVSAATPMNSGPWVSTLKDGLERIESYGGRSDLTQTFREMVVDICEIVILEAVMLGGSYINRNNSEPKDVDGVLFYRLIDSDLGNDPISRIVGTLRRFQKRSMDVRIVPVDSDSWILIKMVAYFANLYGQNRADGRTGGSMLLIP